MAAASGWGSQKVHVNRPHRRLQIKRDSLHKRRRTLSLSMRIREWIGHNMERSWIYGIDGLAFAGEGQFRFGVWPQFDVRRPNHEYLTILWPI